MAIAAEAQRVTGFYGVAFFKAYVAVDPRDKLKWGWVPARSP